MRWLKCMILLLSGIGVLICTVVVGAYYWNIYQEDRVFQVLAQQKEYSMNVETDEQAEEGIQRNAKQILPSYYQNPDCVGWIEIEDTKINYPVMQHPTDGEYYLKRNFDGEYAYSGTPFLDEKCDINNEASHQIIYGHNMKNGTMFGNLKAYKEKAYWEQHDTIILETAEGIKSYRIFAVLNSPKETDYFELRKNLQHKTEDEYVFFVEKLKNQALYPTGLMPQDMEQLLFLVTCDENSNAKGRLIIAAYNQPKLVVRGDN
ncbi:MAG: class B sortase [Cellulosilyticaceae bacterium]